MQAVLEYGLFPRGSKSWNPRQVALTHEYVTAMLKNDGKTKFALKGADAQSGKLTLLWEGALPQGYSPMEKQGAIVLGSGGDCCARNTNQSLGTFYEGAIVSGYPSDPTDQVLSPTLFPRAGAAHYHDSTAVESLIAPTAPEAGSGDGKRDAGSLSRQPLTSDVCRSRSASCAEGLCASSKKCETPPKNLANGAACSDDAQCLSGSCAWNSVCDVPGPSTRNCNSAPDCQSGLLCFRPELGSNSGYCAPPPSLSSGAKCSGIDSNCRTGSCSWEGICAERVGKMMKCDSSADCQLGLLCTEAGGGDIGYCDGPS